ncbi:hypothetical protein F5Y00DRAFT_266233 [Daldinia vernicosa]|uniref:uncharacterized protein n=1 Tax=Daldinia vernicosa TaxID=114800 RepID=UPI0020076242|nr:uncharacterized protein F5Y00DRAFT_266233 [Daldinia vernicosa]KAI0844811.1 hypothetical protein F5Y00DRAFT_266233 [Daldinia vernicosa]
MTNSTSNRPDSIVWVKGMKLGPGGPHDASFWQRVQGSRRHSGAGTIENPRIIWATPNPERGSKEDRLQAIENIVRRVTSECGLSYAWMASDAHPTCTTGWVRSKRVIGPDDYHVTLRMGSGPHTCNLHGHIYLICEDNNLNNEIVRPMTTEERSIVGGFSPQLLVWGKYPAESAEYPRSGLQVPRPKFEIKPGSILQYQKDTKQIPGFV